MKAFTSILLAFAASAAANSVYSLPSCAQTCYTSAASTAGCDGVTDASCICSSTFLTPFAQCYIAACDTAEQVLTITLTAELCSSSNFTCGSPGTPGTPGTAGTAGTPGFAATRTIWTTVGESTPTYSAVSTIDGTVLLSQVTAAATSFATSKATNGTATGSSGSATSSSTLAAYTGAAANSFEMSSFWAAGAAVLAAAALM